MYRRIATALLLLAAALLLLSIDLLAPRAASARRRDPSRPPLPTQVLLPPGADANDAWGSGGRSSWAHGHRQGEGWRQCARRLGQRAPVKNPPSPNPNRMRTMFKPVPPPPPPPYY